MEIRTVAELINGLARHETWKKLLDETVPASKAWLNCIREQFDSWSAIRKAKGVDKLIILCQSEGREFGCAWLTEKRGELHIDRGVPVEDINSMSAAELYDTLRGRKPANSIAKGGRRKQRSRIKAEQLIKKAVEEGNYNRSKISQQTGLGVDHISTIKSKLLSSKRPAKRKKFIEPIQ